MYTLRNKKIISKIYLSPHLIWSTEFYHKQLYICNRDHCSCCSVDCGGFCQLKKKINSNDFIHLKHIL